uniref:Acyl-CoA thioesterase 2 C-terminal domain-containing protein n=1 Tax=Araucaria cunninghamii TaxID=56994 RepID=A0A0D6QV64_ARACU
MCSCICLRSYLFGDKCETTSARGCKDIFTPHQREGVKISSLSLDHSMWFHKPFKADEWLLYVQESPIASSGRGFNIGHMYTRSGELAMSLTQEGVIRRKKQPTSKL